MEPLNVAALIIFVSLLAAALEIFGLFRFTTCLRGLPKRRPPDGLS